MSVHEKGQLSDYLRKRHSVTKLVVHLVFITKYRRKLFDGYMIGQLREAFESACESWNAICWKWRVKPTMLHLRVAYPPKLAVSVLVNNLKSVSSRRIRLLNTHVPRQSKSAALWSRSYFACSAGGTTIETLRKYVQSQATPE